jgi:hypothetical protein
VDQSAIRNRTTESSDSQTHFAVGKLPPLGRAALSWLQTLFGLPPPGVVVSFVGTAFSAGRVSTFGDERAEFLLLIAANKNPNWGQDRASHR